MKPTRSEVRALWAAKAAEAAAETETAPTRKLTRRAAEKAAKAEAEAAAWAKRAEEEAAMPAPGKPVGKPARKPVADVEATKEAAEPTPRKKPVGRGGVWVADVAPKPVDVVSIGQARSLIAAAAQLEAAALEVAAAREAGADEERKPAPEVAAEAAQPEKVAGKPRGKPNNRSAIGNYAPDNTEERAEATEPVAAKPHKTIPKSFEEGLAARKRSRQAAEAAAFYSETPDAPAERAKPVASVTVPVAPTTIKAFPIDLRIRVAESAAALEVTQADWWSEAARRYLAHLNGARLKAPVNERLSIDLAGMAQLLHAITEAAAAQPQSPAADLAKEAAQTMRLYMRVAGTGQPEEEAIDDVADDGTGGRPGGTCPEPGRRVHTAPEVSGEEPNERRPGGGGLGEGL